MLAHTSSAAKGAASDALAAAALAHTRAVSAAAMPVPHEPEASAQVTEKTQLTYADGAACTAAATPAHVTAVDCSARAPPASRRAARLPPSQL